MHPTVLLLLLVAWSLLLHLPGRVSADCEPAVCGNLTLRYPFWLGSGNQTSSPCGHPAFEVWCGDDSRIASLKGSSIHVLAIDYANSSFVASHSRVAAGDDGVCRADFNMSISIALSPFTISPRNRALCFLSKCDGPAPSGPGFVNATSNCSAPHLRVPRRDLLLGQAAGDRDGLVRVLVHPGAGAGGGGHDGGQLQPAAQGRVRPGVGGGQRRRLRRLQRERRAVPVRQRR